MAATSPYSQNDYQALSNFRPYELPINDIFKGITAQNQFWDAGAARVKSVYDSALNLNLTLDENKVVRKKFLEDAEKEMTKLSAMNLADPSVQRQGMKVFTKLFQDDAIMQDDYLTKLQSTVYSDAERFKNDEKSKGEGFHMDNLAYALKDFKGFGKGTSRQAISSIFDKAKNAEYIPHHNVSKEYLDVAAKCKPDEFSRNTIQGLYFLNRKSESQTASNLQGCIKAGISDKAWQQLKITGSVRYGEDYAALGRSYQGIIDGNNHAASERIMGLSAEKKKLSDAGQLTPEIEKAYDNEMGSLRSQVKDNNVQHARITAGDFSEVEKNYDSIVSQVYANQDIGGFSQAFAFQKESEEWKTNPSGIAQYNQMNQNARQTQQLQFQGYWKGKEFEQKERENDISLLKALMGGGSGGAGSSSSLLGMAGGAATYQFLKPLFQKVGLNIDESIGSVLGEAGKVEGVGETVDTINRKAEQFHHQRVQQGEGLLNMMKNLVGPEGIEALNNSVKGTSGAASADAIYDAADKYISDYYKTYKGGPVSDDIKKLERMTSDYENSRTQVFEFMRMRDEINTKIDKDPALKKVKTELDEDLNKLVTTSKTAITGYDQYKQQSVIFYPKDLAEMAKGTHELYKFREGKIVHKNTNVELQGNVDTSLTFTKGKEKYIAAVPFSGSLRGERQIPQAGYTSVDMGGNSLDAFSTIGKYSQNMKKRTEKLAPALNNIVQDVARNNMYYTVGAVPGLENSIKQQFNEFPEFNTPDVTYAPTRTFKDNDGDWVTEVKVFRSTKKDGNVTTTPITEELKEAVVNSQYAANSGFNNVKILNGETLVVKTPYLPMSNTEYPLSNSISNMVYAAKQQPLANGETLTQTLKRTGGGFKIGFDIIGGGTTYTGEKAPQTYRPWYMTPDGKKELVGVETPLENDLSNQLSSLENNMPMLRQKFAVKPQTTK